MKELHTPKYDFEEAIATLLLHSSNGPSGRRIVRRLVDFALAEGIKIDIEDLEEQCKRPTWCGW